MLDVGTGPFMLLGRMAQRAGASCVACVESSASSVGMAVELMRLEYLNGDWRRALQSSSEQHPADVDDGEWVIRNLDLPLSFRSLTVSAPLSAARDSGSSARGVPRPVACAVTELSHSTCDLCLFEGLSSCVALPPRIDLVVHEILGHIASSEGAVKVMRELRSRPGLLTADCKVIPRAAGTFIVPTAPLELSLLERLVSFADSGATLPFPQAIYRTQGVPRENFLDAPQLMEWFDFTKSSELDTRQRRVCDFKTQRDTKFDGLHLSLAVELDEFETIDSHKQTTSWSCTYIRLFAAADAVFLPAGAMVRFTCMTDVSSDCPEYTVHVSIARDAQEQLCHLTTYSWRGLG